MRRVATGTIAVLAVLTCFALTTSAQAAFPGKNGKIAFVQSAESWWGAPSDIYTVNPDGTGLANLTNTPGDVDSDPAWSPDGRQIAFLTRRVSGSDYPDLDLMNADGTGRTRLLGEASRRPGLDWSPDGQRIVFSHNNSLMTIKPDGTGLDAIGPPGGGFACCPFYPTWSPDGSRIAYTFYGDPNLDIQTMKANGTDVRTLVGTSNIDEQPDWSPDGSRIIFNRDYDLLYTIKPDGTDLTPVADSQNDMGGHAWSPDGTRLAVGRYASATRYDIYTRSATGVSANLVFSSPEFEWRLDWQPIPYTGYARPKGATPFLTYLVPEYDTCETPNREHGPPLAFGSCSPPQPTSDWLTVGTADSNGQPTKSIGSVRLDTILGNPATPADDADMKVEVVISDVRNQSDLSDYTGELEAKGDVRITDKNNDVSPGGGTDPGTMIDIGGFPLAQVSCVSTADPTIGGECNLTTTMDAMIPASVKEGKRAIWQVGQVVVIDGGSDGLLGTTPNTVFLKQGIFVP